MMDSKQTRIALGVMAFVLFAWLLSLCLLSSHEPARPPSRISLSFDASRAYAAIEEFTKQFPHRVFGSLESRQSTGYLHDRLAEMGYTVSYIHFDGRIGRRSQAGRNVLAYKKGLSTEILAVVAHYDTARTTIQGATDNGSGVGVLLETARIFAASPTQRSLLFIFSDGGEWGSLGARDIAENYPQRARIAAVLSLDHVSAGDLAAFCLEATGQLDGFAPAWLRRLARQAAEAQGLPVMEPSGIQEHFERALLISAADQGPFLKAGIPAINLGSVSVDRARDKAIYHSSQDTIENLKISGLEKYGLTAERIVRTLDAVQSMPARSSGSFRLWDALYLKPTVISPLHAISFLPFVIIFYFHLRNYHKRMNRLGIGREFLVCLGTVLPFLAVYFFISLARALRQLPFYSLYPATAKDPVLLNPPWNVLGIILGAALILGIFFYIIGKYSIRELPKPDFYVSKLILLVLLLLTITLAFLRNSYWATAFLLLPSWIWALVGCGRTQTERIQNGIWILVAGIPYYAALWVYSTRLDMGWNFIWYQVLALNSGLFAAPSFILGTVAAVLGIRFLIIQIREMAS
jgi:hypothetical protein